MLLSEPAFFNAVYSKKVAMETTLLADLSRVVTGLDSSQATLLLSTLEPVLASCWIASCPIAIWYYNRKPQIVRRSSLLSCKLAIAAIVAAISAFSASPAPKNAFLSSAAAICLVPLLYFEHSRKLRSSAWLAISIIISIIYDAFHMLHYTPKIAQNKWSMASSTTFIVSKSLILCLEEMSKAPYVICEEQRTSLRHASASSGFLHRLLVSWLGETVLFGFRNTTAMQSTEELNLNSSVNQAIQPSDVLYMRDVKERKRLLSTTCIRKILCSAAMVLLPRICLMAVTLIQPFYIASIITFADDSFTTTAEMNDRRAHLFRQAVLLYTGIAVSRASFAYSLGRFMTLVRGIITSRICIKTFDLLQSEAQQIKAVALLNVNIDGIAEGIQRCFNVLTSPFEFGICLYMLNSMIGPASILIIIPTVVSSFAAWCLSRQMPPSNTAWTEATSTRASKTSEMLARIHTIRKDGLHQVVTNLLQRCHDYEMTRSRRSRGWFIALMLTRAICDRMTGPIVLGCGLLWATAAGTLTPQQAYGTFAIVMLATDPLEHIIKGYPEFSAVLGHVRQIERYIAQQDVFDERTERINTNLPDEAVEFEAAMIAAQGTEKTLLADLSLTVSPGELLMVIGPTAAGKSTFIRSIINEAAIRGGSRFVRPGPIAYCDQTPWLCHLSIRENIVGALPLDEQWYTTVLEACELQPDLHQLVRGDATMIGHQGANISTGQKHKIALARAVYSRSDLFALDDVFSALDRDTAHNIFSRLLGDNGLLRQSHSTVVMTTHAKEFLNQADRILVIEADGESSVQRYHNNPALQRRLGELGCSLNAFADVEAQASKEANGQPGQATPASRARDQNQDINSWCLHSFYWSTFPRASLFAFLAGTVVAVLTEMSPIAVVRIWLETDPTSVWFFKSYVALSIITCVAMGMCLCLWFLYLVPASTHNIHQLILSTLMRSTWGFLAKTDHGAILHLLNHDLNILPRALAAYAMRTVYYSCTYIVTTGVAMSSTAFNIVVPLFMVVFCYVLQLCYLKRSRHFEKQGEITNSQLQSQLVNMASGLQHIRSFGWESAFLKQTQSHLLASQHSFYLKGRLETWLKLTVDLANILPTAGSIWYALHFKVSGTQIGMALVLLMKFSELSVELVRLWTTFETMLASIVRLRDFITTTPLETEPKAEDAVVPDESEKFGRVMLHDVAAWHESEATSPPIVMASFSIPPGSKVGIEGRTGIGKTSFFLTLLNFLEYRGRITIDHTDIKKIPREVLRSSIITTLSPEVIEFDESVRYNLCPWTMEESPGEGNPHAIGPVEILQELGLWDIVAPHGGLNARMSELGLSHGQKQLFCIARACLQKLSTGSRLVLMDDVTSGLDDDAVKAARDVMDIAFDDCTVFMVSNNPQHLENCNYMLRFDNGVMRIRSREPANKTPAPPLPPNFVNPPTGMGSQPGMDHLLAFITNGERLAQQQIAEMKRRGAL